MSEISTWFTLMRCRSRSSGPSKIGRWTFQASGRTLFRDSGVLMGSDLENDGDSDVEGQRQDVDDAEDAERHGDQQPDALRAGKAGGPIFGHHGVEDAPPVEGKQ